VRDVAITEFVGGLAAGRLAVLSARNAARGNLWYKMGNNPYARIGLTYMGGPGKTPALRIGTASSEAGKFLTHIDLRLSKPFSSFSARIIKRCK